MASSADLVDDFMAWCLLTVFLESSVSQFGGFWKKISRFVRLHDRIETEPEKYDFAIYDERRKEKDYAENSHRRG
ncbi:MAG: hypothetical protein PUK54_02540 [Firmicutes bacterium]|nr:hypothetical protein [Bacillota bacterium]MDD7601473.1 hypothetical protein [Bacillota bacterium]MDY5857045.1 hypothetical protein [Anaerovoracaceae bacterium]